MMQEIDALNEGNVPFWLSQEATLKSLDQLVTLEKACFSVPWSRQHFHAELEGNQFSRVRIIPHPECTQNLQIIAYICVWIVFEEIRYLNLAVHPDFRRRGLAKQLIHETLDLGMRAGCCRGMLEVRKTNDMAKNLYESFNFKSYSTRKSYYTNPTEDAILMTLDPLATHDDERRDGRGNAIGSQTTIHTIS